jgi:hypothetical protein
VSDFIAVNHRVTCSPSWDQNSSVPASQPASQPARMAMVHAYRKTEYTRAIPKLISGELLAKQAMRKNIIYKKLISGELLAKQAMRKKYYIQKINLW